MKKKILIIISILLSFLFLSGITYSFFNSGSNLTSSDQNIAKFIFNAKKIDSISLDINNLLPGEEKKYMFSVTNSTIENISDVKIEYQITIKTYHFIPIIIRLYKIDNNIETLVSTCDENYSRNSNNELVCNMPIEEMNMSSVETDNYELRINFPIEYNDSKYSDLVDYIDIELGSWQKT